jgi:hypothetical protein
VNFQKTFFLVPTPNKPTGIKRYFQRKKTWNESAEKGKEKNSPTRIIWHEQKAKLPAPINFSAQPRGGGTGRCKT